MRTREIKKGVIVIVIGNKNNFLDNGKIGTITDMSNGYVYVLLDGNKFSRIFRPKELKVIQFNRLNDVTNDDLVYRFVTKPLISKKTIDIIDEINRKASEAFAEQYNKEIRNINQPVTKYEIKITKKNNISALLWVLYVELLVLGFFIGYLYF